jgi:hypothetical protein
MDLTHLASAKLACHHKILKLKYEIARDGKMPILLHVGGFTVTIFRKKTDEVMEQERAAGTPNPNPYLAMPDFTYTSDCLAHLIVDAWVDQNYQKELLDREIDPTTGKKTKVTNAAARLATFSVNKCGFNLKRAVVISEAEYYDGYYIPLDSPEVVFVLPMPERVQLHPGPLLKTAELLMASVPNGI